MTSDLRVLRENSSEISLFYNLGASSSEIMFLELLFEVGIPTNSPSFPKMTSTYFFFLSDLFITGARTRLLDQQRSTCWIRRKFLELFATAWSKNAKQKRIYFPARMIQFLSFEISVEKFEISDFEIPNPWNFRPAGRRRRAESGKRRGRG